MGVLVVGPVHPAETGAILCHPTAVAWGGIGVKGGSLGEVVAGGGRTPRISPTCVSCGRAAATARPALCHPADGRRTTGEPWASSSTATCDVCVCVCVCVCVWARAGAGAVVIWWELMSGLGMHAASSNQH
jgi:hypothetical protein